MVARPKAPPRQGSGRQAAAQARKRPVRAPRGLPRSLPLGPARPGSGGAVAGVDEAGRGPWAGPVVAAAVALGPGVRGLEWGVTDSKKLGEQQRERVYAALTGEPRVSWGVAVVSHARIDKINILQASLEAMARAVRSVKCRIGKVLIDGNQIPKQLAKHECKAIIGGDRKHFAIAAASIIAKVTRDRLMAKLDRKYPQYGFKSHKGYGTAAHRKALVRHGVSKVHRLSFKPMRGLVERSQRGQRSR